MVVSVTTHRESSLCPHEKDFLLQVRCAVRVPKGGASVRIAASITHGAGGSKLPAASQYCQHVPARYGEGLHYQDPRFD